jgi:hypothetical protein
MAEFRDQNMASGLYEDGFLRGYDTVYEGLVLTNCGL